MIQEKDFLYRVPVKTAPITTPGGQIRNPEILVDVEGGEFMHGNILDANSTNKLINQSVKDAVDDKFIESGYVTKDLLEAETSARTKGDEDLGAKIQAEQTRAEGKEKEISDKLAIVDGDSNTEGSFRKAIADVIAAAPEDLDTLKEIADKLADNDDLHTALNQAITEKADASALANEVARATGVESGLQAAIGAKQDAGSYIPYDQTVTSRYKIDKDLMIDNSKGSVVLGTYNISAISNGNTEIQINPSGITMRDDDNVIMLCAGGIILPNGDDDHVLTSHGTTLNMTQYVTNSEISGQINAKADRLDLFTLEKKVTANTTALEDKQDAGNYIPYDPTNPDCYTINTPISLVLGGRYKTELRRGDIYMTNNDGGTLTLSVGQIYGNSGPNTSFTVSSSGILLSEAGEIQITHTGFIMQDQSGTSTLRITPSGITFNGRSDSDIPTADGTFINVNDLASADDVSSLRAGLSIKQNKITVNEVDITDIETADITKLRTIVTNLINALSASDLIKETKTIE